ncbi:DUF3253 domain-containing protein [Aurantiacibacter poecillastricola]|uniref:DUF3253 domain-containing protein n=1 Tax=Aurantiacibacter poecillastricola TaxID=3064385 RepID=UPI00273DCF8E|nr:DUF3253 domain-containing protein [Aurantiacibacter sp. 219JJ12-13]MDP5263490.1 DUF3253 domain-containing protein [Aurantiacibacter sp. 219JJ12-13]
MTAREAIDRLLHQRGPDKTICPSEAARLLAGEDGDWRSRMEEVHAAVRDMSDNGAIRLSWQGEPLSSPRGPYRIASAE